MSTTAINVRNITTYNQSFDDKTLTPGGSTVVHRLTDDLLSAYWQGRVLLDPAPNTEELAIRTFSLNPCQLPLPMRLVGGFQGLFTPTSIQDGISQNVGDTPVMLVPPDNSRVNFRFRNTGPNPVGIGGPQVDFTTAVHILAVNEVFDERFTPNVAWYAIAQVGLPATLVGMAVKT